MALWGKTDAAASVPKWLEDDANNTNKSHDKDNVVFVDVAEAKVPANRAKGLVTPGWNLYHTYTTATGSVRHIVEPLVAMKLSAALAGDAGVTGNTAVEDAIAADPTITISVQPAAESANSTTDAVFTVTAAADNGGVLAYQWESSADDVTFATVASANGVSGETTATLTLTPDATLHADGNYFRVVISTDGAASVTSNSALLTVA
jgi:hypothetical protein